MANTPISNLINNAARLVVDKNMIRWDKAFWVDAFNAALVAVLDVRPDALTKDLDFTCIAGPKQTLPDEANRIIDIVGNKNGPALTGSLDLKMMNDYRPEWRTQTAADTITGWMVDERNLETFYTYPPATTNAILEIVISKVPDKVTVADYDGNTPCEIKPMYDNAIIEFLIYRAFSEDAEFTANDARAVRALNNFRVMLGDKAQADAINDQKTERINNQPR
ncbi:TPA: hypothetical protein P0E30_003767 [Vibrio harveyi]|nr:hypothetical protein [Vibrio harveyi]